MELSLTAIAVIGIISLLFLLVIGMDIGLAMLIVGFLGYALITGPTAALGMLRQAPATMAASYSLCVIPLFIMMGNFAYASGVSEGLFTVGDKWLSRLPGGLACATIISCAIFGAVCGSTAATAATMGIIAVPAMRKFGYSDALSTGTVSVGGTLGIMIPPSTPLIVYGIMAEQSIGSLFAAGIVPGIMMAALCIVTIIIQVKLNPKLAPSTDRVITWKERIFSLKELFWIVILFGVVLGGMFSGFFTINEAAAFGAFGGLLIMIIRKKFTWKSFKAVMKDSVKTTAMCYLILIGADLFGRFLVISQLPLNLASFIGTLAVSKYLIMAVIVVIYAVMGCFMDALPMITLTVPIFLPIVTQLGFDPIWFGVLCIMVMMLGLVTPPVGLNCYVISGVAKDVPLSQIFKGSFPFFPALSLSIVLIIIFPQIVLWLPNLLR